MTSKTVPRICLIAVGFLLPLVMLELGFRIAGSAFMAGDRIDVSTKGVYRILCLGESTTQSQWPQPLQEKLNRRNIGIRFQTIDRGRAGTGSAAILFRLEHELNAYRPEMVVVMMGINDGEWVWENPVAYENTLKAKTQLFLKNLRLNKLMRFIHSGLARRWGGGPSVKRNAPKVGPGKTAGQDDLMKYIALGNGYRQKGEYDKAEEAFLNGIDAAPDDPRGYVELGEFYRHKGEYEKAVEQYEAGILKDPHDSAAYVGLGAVYCTGDAYDRVVRLYEASIRDNPRDPRGYVRLGNLHQRRMKYDKAVELYQAGIRAAPRDSLAYTELSYLYHMMGNDEMATNVMERALQAMPDDLRLYSWLGEMYCKMGKYDQAERVYREGIQANPGQQQGYIELGNMYCRAQKYDQAVDFYQKGLRAAPAQSQVYLALGDFYGDRGDYEQAERMYKIYADRNPEDYRVYMELGGLYRKKGKFDAAAKMDEIAIGVCPRNAQLCVKLGGFYHLRGDHGKAKAVVERGYSLIGDRPALRGAMVLASFLEGQKSLAERYRRKSYLRLEIAQNYRRLRDMVLASGAELVCMQYPMRDIGPLKEVLGNDRRIHYVENRKNFEEALRKYSYSEVFKDAFAGDFGHCTDMGNGMIAKNLANVILREVFGVSGEESRETVLQ